MNVLPEITPLGLGTAGTVGGLLLTWDCSVGGAARVSVFVSAKPAFFFLSAPRIDVKVGFGGLAVSVEAARMEMSPLPSAFGRTGALVEVDNLQSTKGSSLCWSAESVA